MGVSEIDPYDELQQQVREARERFATDVEGAEMIGRRDDGVYRHLVFRFPKATWRWCEVVTWPHMLVLNGGLGCWTFSRVEDMLGFFRPSPNMERVPVEYWAEKLHIGGRDSAKEFDPKRAAFYIRRTGVDHIVVYPEFSRDVEDWLFSDWCGEDLSTEAGLRDALGRFEGRHEDTQVRFPVEEWDLYRYRPWFVLSCQVLPWAVEQYDAALAPVG